MNSTAYFHFHFPPQGIEQLDGALGSLSAWIDAERDLVGRVFAQTGQRQVCRALDTLDQLHIEPDTPPEEIWEMLEEAAVCLEVLLEALRVLPYNCKLETAWGLRGPAPFDAHVRWSGARLEDIHATLEHALSA